MFLRNFIDFLGPAFENFLKLIGFVSESLENPKI